MSTKYLAFEQSTYYFTSVCNYFLQEKKRVPCECSCFKISFGIRNGIVFEQFFHPQHLPKVLLPLYGTCPPFVPIYLFIFIFRYLHLFMWSLHVSSKICKLVNRTEWPNQYSCILFTLWSPRWCYSPPAAIDKNKIPHNFQLRWTYSIPYYKLCMT